MEELFARFKEFVEENKLLKPREKVIIGVSGGPDSIFLLHMFSRLRKTYKNEIIVAHLNHLLRKESGREEEFVNKIASEQGMKFVSERKDVKKYFKGDSLEQTSRNIRYDFFLKLCRHYKIKKLAMAHHKDDLVETVLLRMIRGSGLLGLKGMLPLSKYKNIFLIRPLLFLEKDQILEALKKEGIKYMVDKSNFQDIFLRNKVRLKLIPELVKINPSIKDNLYNLAKNVSLDYDFISAQAEALLGAAIIHDKANFLELSRDKLAGIHQALFNNVLRSAIERIKGNLRSIDSRHIDEIRDLFQNRPLGSVVDIPCLKVIKEQKSLVFKRCF